MPTVERRGPRRDRDQRSPWGAHLVITAAIGAAYLFGALDFLEFKLVDWRFALNQRDASEDIVVVGIDSQSLREIDVWPWPRSHHADVLDTLLEWGAAQVAFDIDFSSRSTQAQDERFEDSLRRAGGRTILPVVEQPWDDDAGAQPITAPLPRFRNHARLASANVIPASDGLVRYVPMRHRSEGIDVPSLSAALAGGSTSHLDTLQVDYGIRAGSIVTISYADILFRRVDPSLVAGRSVIIGATAVELGDILSVPNYRVLPGPLVQALAYETAVQDRAIRRVDPLPILAITLLLSFCARLAAANLSWERGLVVAGSLAVLSLAAAFATHAWLSVGVDTVPFLLLLLADRGIFLIATLRQQGQELYKSTLSAIYWSRMMRQLVQQTFDAVLVLDSRGNVALFNPGAQRMFGYREVDVIGNAVTKLLPPSDDNEYSIAADHPLAAAYSNREAGVPTEISARRQDGSIFPLEVTITPVETRMTSHELERRRLSESCLVVVARDLTVIKQTQDDLERAKVDAESASRAKSEFMAAMGHELRTPLNAIIGFSEIIQARMFGALGCKKYEDYVDDINQSASHLLVVVNDILDVTKAEAGMLEVSEQEVDVAKVIGDAVEMVRRRAQDGHITLAADVPNNIPMIRADPNKITQLLLNLIMNSVKFTPEGGSVSVTVRWRPDQGLIFTVSDTGIGIAEEDIAKALEPFSQVDSRLSRKYEGTGLGLPLARKLAEVHGGTLFLESEPGVGTTVTVTIPTWRLAAAAPALPQPIETAA